MSIAVIVLGDLDRSPRMLNHALEASKTLRVTLIGYQGSSMPSAITASTITTVFLSVWIVDLLRKLPRWLYPVYAILRIIIQSF